MSITASELHEIIPFLDNNQAISVGFNTADSVREIKQMLLSILNPKFAKDEKQNEDIKKINEKINHSLVDNALAQRKAIEKNEEYIKKLQTVSDETRKAIEELKGYSVSFLDIATKTFTNYMQDALKLSNIFRDIESSGVLVNGGFKSLGSTASSLGMTYEELAGHLKKTAPLISKLNSSYKDGVDIFRQSINNISNDYNLTHEEQVAAFNAALENLAPSQLRQMSEKQLIATVDETAKQMKLLSLATGKSIENIKQENELKARSGRIKAWMMNPENKKQYQILTALGLNSDEMMDYIISGGTRTSAEIFTKIAGSPYLQAALPEIMNMVQRKQLNLQGVNYLQQQYGGYAQQRLNEIQQNAENRAIYSASAVNPLFENINFEATADEALLNFNQARLNKILGSEERQIDNNLLNSFNRAGELTRSRDTEFLRAKTGGPEGMTKAFNAYATANNLIAGPLGWANNILDKLGLSGMTSGMTVSAIGSAGESLFNYGVSKFSTAVNIFFAGVLANNNYIKNLLGGFSGKIKNLTSVIPAIGGKLLKASGIGLAGTAVGSGLDYVADNYIENKTGKSLAKIISSTASWAGVGAAGGSLVGGIGAIPGAIGGGLLGLGKGIYDQFFSEPKHSEYSQITADKMTTNKQYEDNVYIKNGIDRLTQTAERIAALNEDANNLKRAEMTYKNLQGNLITNTNTKEKY